MFLAELVGERPAAGWLAEAHNEHRFPLPRFLWLACHRLTGFDFCVPLLLSAALVSAAALAFVAAARTTRGRSRVADQLLPALLLHLGHWENWLIGYQLAFTVSVAAVAFVLASAASGCVNPTACAAATAALALCGGAGVLLALPVALWVGWAAVRTRRWAEAGLVAAVRGYAGRDVVLLRPATVRFGALGLCAASVGQGVEYGEYYRHGARAMAYRVRAGATADDLVPEFVTKVFAGADTPQHRTWMRDGLGVLERRGLGPYRAK